MRSLDEHLRDASRAWMDEATPMVVAHADTLARTLRAPRWWAWGFSVLGVGIVSTALWFTFGPRDEAVPVVHTPPTWTITAPASTDAPVSAPAPQPARVSTTTRSASPAAPSDAAPRTSPFAVTEPQDGFLAEYERIVAAAVQIEEQDPLRAVSEYRGVAAISRRHGHAAHAVTALERAASVAERIGDATLSARIAAELASARSALPRDH